MVLKNSKYDKQAKRKYMAKHGLLQRPDGTKQPRAKWSSKKKSESQETMKLDIDEMTSDWDSDVDEDIVNYFYPQLGEDMDSIPVDQKRKIKRQIIEDLKLQRDEMFNKSDDDNEQEQETEQYQDQDGIYLGTNPPPQPQPQPQSSVALSEFLPEIPMSNKRLNRKLPKSQQSEDFLQEYGIDNYKDIIREKDDYDILHKKKLEARNLNEILANELIGFKVGKDSLGDGSRIDKNPNRTIRQLTKEEVEQEEARKRKDDQNKFYNEMKNKFTHKEPVSSKVLELNNYNKHNQDHVNYLNNKIINQGVGEQQSGGSLDDDLDVLLGDKLSTVDINRDDDKKDDVSSGGKNGGKNSSAAAGSVDDIDSFLNGLSSESKQSKETTTTIDSAPSGDTSLSGDTVSRDTNPNTNGQDYLDDLLNI